MTTEESDRSEVYGRAREAVVRAPLKTGPCRLPQLDMATRVGSAGEHGAEGDACSSAAGMRVGREARTRPASPLPHHSEAFENCWSKTMSDGGKSTRLTKAAASAAPCSRSIFMSSHSTESGPS